MSTLRIIGGFAIYGLIGFIGGSLRASFVLRALISAAAAMVLFLCAQFAGQVLRYDLSAVALFESILGILPAFVALALLPTALGAWGASFVRRARAQTTSLDPMDHDGGYLPGSILNALVVTHAAYVFYGIATISRNAYELKHWSDALYTGRLSGLEVLGICGIAILVASTFGSAVAGWLIATRRKHRSAIIAAGICSIAIPIGTIIGTLTIVTIMFSSVRARFGPETNT